VLGDRIRRRLRARPLGHEEDPPALTVLALERDDSDRRALWFDRIVDNESRWKGSYFATAADGALYLVQPPPRTVTETAVPLVHPGDSKRIVVGRDDRSIRPEARR